MQTSRINSTPRLFPSGCSLSLVAIVLCAALCQVTCATRRIWPSGFRTGDIVEGFYTPDQTWYGAHVAREGHDSRGAYLVLVWDDGSCTHVDVENVRFISARDSNGDRAIRFRSALGIESLTAMVLQYTMHSREARQKLTADPTLAHLYHDHARGFQDVPPGVEVIGAGDTQLNGWYTRKDAREGPPNGFSIYSDWADWISWNAGHYWYVKDDGCHIRAINDIDHLCRYRGWMICGSKYGDARYYYATAEVQISDPLTEEGNDLSRPPRGQGWNYNMFPFAPVPTLRVRVVD